MRSEATKILPDLSRIPHEYVCYSQQFTTTIAIVVNRGQNHDSVTGAYAAFTPKCDLLRTPRLVNRI